jgi:hypothetical protein
MNEDEPDEEGRSVFKMSAGIQIPFNEAVGNAIVVTKAPEMLKALRRIASARREDGAYDKHDMAGAIVIAEQVVNKVESAYAEAFRPQRRNEHS